MNPSIQRRLSLWLSLVILGAGTIAGVFSYILAYGDSTESQDAQLIQVASALSRGSYKDVPPSRDAEEATSVDAFIVVPVNDAAGAAIRGVQLTTQAKSGLQTVTQTSGTWRVYISRDSNGERFGIAQSMEARAEDARDSARLTIVPIVLLIPLLLASVHLVLKALFEPLKELANRMDRMGDARMTSIAEPKIPKEVVPFVAAVNSLLSRLGQTMVQQSRFIADAAHELRSPVAALMVQAENVQYCDLSSEARDRVQLLRAGLVRMSSLQDQLLSFARVRASSTASPQVLEFDAIVRLAIEDLIPMANAKQIDFGCSRLEPVKIVGEMHQAASLVRNAIDNAIRYTAAGGVVDVSLFQEGCFAHFVVEDTGPGIENADLQIVFEPFVRVLGTRESGSGLGLAIVRAAAEAMAGDVELTARRDGASGLRFSYRQAAA